MVLLVVPLWNEALGSDDESVGPKDEPESLHPCVVMGVSRRARADEVGVDVKVAVRDEAEVVVLASVEVEDDSVAAHDLGIAANATFLLAVGCGIINQFQTRIANVATSHTRSFATRSTASTASDGSLVFTNRHIASDMIATSISRSFACISAMYTATGCSVR